MSGQTVRHESAETLTNADTGDYRPTTPFLPEPEYAVTRPDTPPMLDPGPTQEAPETPFVSEYILAGEETESADASLRRETLAEIFDREFEQSLGDLVYELQALQNDRFSGEVSPDPLEAERFLSGYVQPLREEMEVAIDRMIDESARLGDAVTESQLDAFLDNFDHEFAYQSPVIENFFKKFVKKVKKAAKAGFKAVKKVGKTLSKLSPVHLVLRKLKKMARPLIQRVLRFALNKLPRRYRPLARKLAKRFLKNTLGEIAEAEAIDDAWVMDEAAFKVGALAIDTELTAYPPAIIAAEMDEVIAGYLMNGEDFDTDPAVIDFFGPMQFEDAIDEQDLDRARERFIDKMTNLGEGESLEPHVEEFVTAVLAAAKLGIKLIGRKRVVKFLSKFVARLIRKFVGRRSSRPLARALVDAGLKLVNLESPDEAIHAANDVLASTVHDTVERFLRETPDEALDDETALEHYARLAFEQSVATNFPTQLIRHELRETERVGAWVSRPAGSRRKRYKKFTQAIDVNLSHHKAAAVKSFAGQSLQSFLKEQLGLPIDTETIEVRLHIYEAVPGTTLSSIASAESDVPGLGSGRRPAWMQLHPLTPAAAATLIPDDAGLGRDVHRRFLISRHRIAAGQRFYFLEIPGARMIQTQGGNGRDGSASGEPVRASRLSATLDLQRQELVVVQYLSEAASTELAAQLRAGGTPMLILKAVEAALRSKLSDVLSGRISSRLRVRGGPQVSGSSVMTTIRDLKSNGSSLAQATMKQLVGQLVQHFKTAGQDNSAAFINASEDPADGVTMTFTLQGIQPLVAALSATGAGPAGALAASVAAVTGGLSHTIRPGYHAQAQS